MRIYIRAALSLAIGLLLNSCRQEEAITPLDDVSVEIVYPTDHSSLNPRGSVEFRGMVTRRDTTIDVTRFIGKWYSDKDGTLHEGNIAKNGLSEFTRKSLSRNIHDITFEVRNEAGTVLTRHVMVTNLVSLVASEIGDFAVSLAWSPGEAEEFSSYKLYRASNPNYVVNADNLLAVFDNFADTTFIDSTAAIGTTQFYQLVVDRSPGTTYASNVSGVQHGLATSVDYPIAKIVVDKRRDLFYGLIVPGRFDENATGYGIVIMGKTNLKVVKRFFEDVRCSDLDIDLAGDYLYISRRREIYKFDLDTRQIVDTIAVKSLTRQIRIGNNNRLYYHVDEGDNYGDEFRIVDLALQQELPAVGASGYRGDFEIDPVDNTIYHGDDLSSNTISAYKTTGDKFTLLKQVRGTDFGGNITVAGSYVMWSYQLFDKQLNFIGDFTHGDIKQAYVDDALPDGSLAFAGGRLFHLADRVPWRRVPGFYDRGQFLDSERLLLIAIQNPQYKQYRTILARYTFVR
jgi:hypothetical protein